MLPFSDRLIAWQRQYGRHDLPWQNTRDPYRIWLSEIMLQQTQVATVRGYYTRFLQRFPDVATLAAASLDDILASWAGLGYYARARNLHRCAQQVVDMHGGRFPTEPNALTALCGIGRSTAAAIAVFSNGRRAAILDGNVKRVLCRHRAIASFPGEKTVETALWALAESLLPEINIEAYTQGLMDLGATVCTRHRPGCASCPVVADCAAHALGRPTDFPVPRPVRARPERREYFVVLCAGDRVLLKRRPLRGVWGGLLAPPEGEPQIVLASLGAAGAITRPLPAIAHDFTHFRLHMQPVLADVSEYTLRPEHPPDWQWVDLASLETVASPAPVLRLLVALRPAANAAD